MWKLKSIIALIGDVVSLSLGLLLTLFIRYGIHGYREILINHAFPFSFIVLISLTTYYIIGLYDLKKFKNTASFFKTVGIASLLNLLTGFAFFYLFPSLPIAPRRNLILFTVIGGALLSFSRYLLNRMFAQQVSRRLLLLGDSPTIERLVHALREHPQLGFEVRSWIKEPTPVTWKQLENTVTSHEITTIAIPPRLKTDPAVLKALFGERIAGVEVVDIAHLFEETLGKTPLGELGGAWFLEHLAWDRIVYERVKVPLEVVVAFVSLILFFPLLALIALAVQSTSRGGALYSQRRVGKQGREFTLYKFRTMRWEAEAGGPRWAEPQDPRCTPIGAFLRRTHLDELPQLWNIMAGDLSFVGPRAERPEFVKELETRIPYYAIRTLVKPGLTGWAQINYRYGASVEDAYEKLEYDIFYIKHRSLILDFLIILKTVKLFFVNLK